MFSNFTKARKSVFMAIACIELVVGVLLCLLAGNLPRKSQIAGTFDLTRTTAKRADYAAELFLNALKALRETPIVGRAVEPEWIKGMQEALDELHQAGKDLDVYEQQVTLSVSATAGIAWLVAAIVFLHAIYLLLALRYGSAYSP